MKNISRKQILKYVILTILIALGNIFMLDASVFAGDMSMHAVYVGRGDAILISSNNHYMLVDSGTSKKSDKLLDYLDKLNIPDKKIDCVVATHPDGDHVGGFSSVFKEYEIGHVYYSPHEKDINAYDNFLEAIKAEGCPSEHPSEGQSWKIGDATVKVIYDGSRGGDSTVADESGDSADSYYNEHSIVLKVTCDNKSILLTGDLPSTMERTLLSEGYDFKADVLKVGHHGAAASSCADFLDAVNPSYAVISCSTQEDNPGTILPRIEVLKRLARRFIKTYRTTDGDVIINFHNGTISTKNKENNGYTCLKDAKITLSNNVFYATGEEIKPTVTVYSQGVLVTPNHYKVTYYSNKKTGTARVRVTANDDDDKYVSYCEQTFLILPQKETLKGSLSDYNSVKLSWNSQSAASGFTIQYSTDKKFEKAVNTVTCNSSAELSKTISGLKFKTKYYFRVRAFTNNVGVGKWSNKVSFKTKKCPAPAKAKITSYKLTGKNNIKISWVQQSSAMKAGYRIQYSTDKTFKKTKKIQTIKYKKTTKTSRVLKNLKKNKTYYIRIQGYNKYGDGKWSKIVTIKTR